MNSTGLNLTRSGPRPGKTRPRVPAMMILRRGPRSFEQTVKNPRALFNRLTDMCT
jgi:hypothetical protein